MTEKKREETHHEIDVVSSLFSISFYSQFCSSSVFNSSNIFRY